MLAFSSAIPCTLHVALPTMSNKRSAESDIDDASDVKRQVVESSIFRSASILPAENLQSDSDSDTDTNPMQMENVDMVAAPSGVQPVLSQQALAARNQKLRVTAQPILISMFNQKGGVGKTTATYEIGFTLSRMGFRVLMADLDPQCSLSSLVQPKHASDIAAADEFKERLAAAAKSDPARLSRMDDIFAPALNDEEQIHVPTFAKHVHPLSVHEYENLFYLPGSLRVSELAPLVSQALSNSAGTRPFAYLVPSMLREVASLNDIDIILADLNPSIDALNQSIIMYSDYIWMPFKPSLGCLDSAINLQSVIPRWFDRMHAPGNRGPLLEQGQGPQLLGTFPQVLQTRMQVAVNVQQKATASTPRVEVLNQSYALWMVRIYTATEQLRQRFLMKQPKQVPIDFGYMFNLILGVKDMAGTGRHVQDSGHPASDLQWVHTKQTWDSKKQDWKKSPTAFSTSEKATKERVHVAYKRIVGFTLRHLRGDHLKQLYARVPQARDLLALYAMLRENIFIKQTKGIPHALGVKLAVASTVAAIPANMAGAPSTVAGCIASEATANQWYTHDEVNGMLGHITQRSDMRCTWVTPLHENQGELEVHMRNRMETVKAEREVQQHYGPYWVFIPIATGGGGRSVQGMHGTHWTLFMLLVDPLSDPHERVKAFFFDPLNQPAPEGAATAIRRSVNEVFGQPDAYVSFDQIGGRVQADGHSCGPWIIEMARITMEVGHGLAHENLATINIEEARARHLQDLQH